MVEGMEQWIGGRLGKKGQRVAREGWKWNKDGESGDEERGTRNTKG